MVTTSPSKAKGSIPDHRAKIPHASQRKYQNMKQKQYVNKFNEDLKNGPYQMNFKNIKTKTMRRRTMISALCTCACSVSPVVPASL